MRTLREIWFEEKLDELKYDEKYELVLMLLQAMNMDHTCAQNAVISTTRGLLKALEKNEGAPP